MPGRCPPTPPDSLGDDQREDIVMIGHRVPRNAQGQDAQHSGVTPEQRAQRLRDVFVVQPAPYRRPIVLLILLMLVSAVLISSMVMPWHRHHVPGGGYTVVYGIRGANWEIALAAALMGVVARLTFRPIGYFIAFLTGTLAFFGFLGMCVDYIDDKALAASLGVDAYYGPRFWVALAGTAGLLSAGVLAWRERP